MHIGIYIDNENIAGVDCSDLMRGNPGIGGTEYCILLLAQAYKQFFSDERVTLFSSAESDMPNVDAIVLVSNIQDLCDKANKLSVDLLVTSAVYKGQPLPKDFFAKIEEKKIKTILWGHNFYLSDFCNSVAKCEYIKANVFVGRQQYDRYVDHRVIKKSTYIYNMYPQPAHRGRNKLGNHVVTYIGSLVPLKGFHILASAWKQVLERVPDAELMVIGSGKLYGRNSKLGQYGIAEEAYEQSFMFGLQDEQGNILPSVHFLGVMGTEKTDIIAQTAVGVVNPSGRTETFGISALDFESLGVPVVTIAKGGFLDTVVDHETGILYQNPSQIADGIVELLKDPVKNELYGANGKKKAEQFMPQRIIGQWDDLFRRVVADKPLQFHKPDDFMHTNLKSIRWKNRQLKNKLRMEYPVSVIGLETLARKLLRMLGK